MPETLTRPQSTEMYNGWTNYETWNAALWIQNDSSNFEVAFGCTSYAQFKDRIGELRTGDGVRWDDPKIDTEELDELLDEFHD